MSTNEPGSLLSGKPDETVVALAGPSGRELEHLISPVKPAEFVQTYFSRRSLNVPGQPGKFDHIFSAERLKEALERGASIRDKRFNIMASFAGGEADGSRKPMFEAQLDQVSKLLATGATICITNIHMADPVLARWAQAIRGQLNFTGNVGVNCYVSPDGSGLSMHYDKRVATTLQIAGKKRWRFSTEAAKPWPDTNAVLKDGVVEPTDVDTGRHPDGMEFEEVELNAGDLLCLPAGAWHAARGIGYSLALNLYFAPRNLLDMLMSEFSAFAAADGAWRGGPPATLDEANGAMPETVKAFLREKLDAFHRKVSEMIEQPEQLEGAWLNALVQAPYTGWQPDPLRPLPVATAQDRFRVVAKGLRFIARDGQIRVPADNGLLAFDASLAPVLKQLSARQDAFSVPDALAWAEGSVQPRDVVELLQTLYRNGLLEMV